MNKSFYYEKNMSVCIYITVLSSKIKIRPTTESSVSITVHVLSVCATFMLKNSLIIQKPASLTWDRIREPAPVASTTSNVRSWRKGENWRYNSSGCGYGNGS